MVESTLLSSSPSKTLPLSSIENSRPSQLLNNFDDDVKSTTCKDVAVNTDLKLKSDKETNTSNFIDDTVKMGISMSDDEFELFVKEQAADCYWEIIAERYRLTLDDRLLENQQLHEIVEELNKENEQLRAISEHSEYLKNIFNKVTSEYDSGIDLCMTGSESIESPAKRQKLV